LASQTSLHQFDRVDGSGDPDALVAYLDALSLDANVLAYNLAPR
jgi:hypothetical protein